MERGLVGLVATLILAASFVEAHEKPGSPSTTEPLDESTIKAIYESYLKEVIGKSLNNPHLLRC